MSDIEVITGYCPDACGWCCTYNLIPVSEDSLDADCVRLNMWRGNEIVEIQDVSGLWLKVYNPCIQLTNTGKCTMHESPDRPARCRDTSCYKDKVIVWVPTKVRPKSPKSISTQAPSK